MPQRFQTMTEEESPMTAIPHSNATDSAITDHSEAPKTKQEKRQERSALTRWFRTFANCAGHVVGNKGAFISALAIVIAWGATGPIFHFSDTWQLIINTGTTIITFLMVFLIQNTQNRDARAINLKLNELIRAIDAARDQMIDIEKSSDLELDVLQAKYEKIKLACPVE